MNADSADSGSDEPALLTRKHSEGRPRLPSIVELVKRGSRILSGSDVDLLETEDVDVIPSTGFALTPNISLFATPSNSKSAEQISRTRNCKEGLPFAMTTNIKFPNWTNQTCRFHC